MSACLPPMLSLLELHCHTITAYHLDYVPTPCARSFFFTDVQLTIENLLKISSVSTLFPRTGTVFMLCIIQYGTPIVFERHPRSWRCTHRLRSRTRHHTKVFPSILSGRSGASKLLISLAHRSYIWLLLTVFLGSFETLVNEAEYAHQAHSKPDIESIPRRIASDWLFPLLQ